MSETTDTGMMHPEAPYVREVLLIHCNALIRSDCDSPEDAIARIRRRSLLMGKQQAGNNERDDEQTYITESLGSISHYGFPIGE